MERVIATSCSNKFFPSLLNFLGSIKNNYPNHPPVVVYDLGLFWFFRKHLEGYEGVTIKKIPRFCNHWRSCYTWKPYIFQDIKNKNCLYLDAGNQVLKSLDDIFDIIDKEGYYTVPQGLPLWEIIPQEYVDLFPYIKNFLNDDHVAAGTFGFRSNFLPIKETIAQTFSAALSGLCLGFSAQEQWRNKGKNRNNFIRGCRVFRHDQTVLNIFLRNNLDSLRLNNLSEYSTHLRLNFLRLRYVYSQHGLSKGNWRLRTLRAVNYLMVRTYLLIRGLWLINIKNRDIVYLH